ncbi:MAG: endonuclease III [Erysipelotrichaceae bacterium]|nr:endonuclease III [Erysipelotrichaceae bacterium]
MKHQDIYLILNRLFPKARCELNHDNAYQLTVAVLLSAQTTDVAVNRLTTSFFKRYPSVRELADAKLDDVENSIRMIGLYHNKAKNLIKMAQQVNSDYSGTIPSDRDDLMRLAGIGRKSANVIMSEWFHFPAIAVDTHVERVSKRLNLAKWPDSVRQVEDKLMKAFPQEQWSRLHHLLIFFGRYRCKAQNPQCLDCPFLKICQKDKQPKAN